MEHTERMTIALPADMASTVKQAVALGDYTSTSEVLYDALSDWQQKRQFQQQETVQMKDGVRKGVADLLRGRTTPANEVFTRLERKYRAA